MANRKRIPVTCICGTEFETIPSKLAEGRGKFCSVSCKYANYTRPTGLIYNLVKENPGRFTTGQEAWNKGLRGRHFSPETEFKPGESVSPETQFKSDQVSGEKNFRWTGGPGSRRSNKLGYSVIHKLVKRERGRAADYSCTFTDETCRGSMQWACISQEYRGIEDFMPLCRSHHVRYDGKVPV